MRIITANVFLVRKCDFYRFYVVIVLNMLVLLFFLQKVEFCVLCAIYSVHACDSVKFVPLVIDCCAFHVFWCEYRCMVQFHFLNLSFGTGVLNCRCLLL